MFELFKKRQLGDYIIDTFTFIKNFGKHFFKIFFIMNGAFLIIVAALVYWFLKINFSVVLENNSGQFESNFLHYFNDNYAVFIGFIVLFFVVILLLSLFNSSYPILYLKLIAQKNTNDFTLDDVLKTFRQSLWKIIKFSIGLILLVVPVLIVVIILLFLLCFVLIGFPLLLIAIPTLFTWLNISFYTYLTEEKSFFQSLNHAYFLMKKDFWSTIGATFLVLIMIQMIRGSITMFFYFIGIFFFFATAIGNPNFDVQPFEGSPILFVFITLIFVLLLTLGNIFNNVIMINQGIIYYSLGAKDKTSTQEIELIGTDNE
ncbi:hypothetical protein CLU81_4073 [Flavobacterium sp. 9]|uniref:hypothetical protein n=1 Tax=Flavobacterium sp. 9 TaxID=2035198 RepID=UPI000C192F58|nr:hypothetical protein [Flavobacterium sp. 9]PIF33459.1 hypothetical protein CLU81_4073 [Flavobacterium sp. 9]